MSKTVFVLCLLLEFGKDPPTPPRPSTLSIVWELIKPDFNFRKEGKQKPVLYGPDFGTDPPHKHINDLRILYKALVYGL